MLSMSHIRKVYRTQLVETYALDDITLEVEAGEFVAVMGRSGSGKTTFLNVAGLLDTFDGGTYMLDGQDVSRLSDSEMSRIRHELNNSLAPVSSLAHSARVAAARPDAATRLPPLLDTIAERVAHVTAFLDGYARFARLPAPRPETVRLSPFLAGVAELFPFTLEAPVGEQTAWFDPAQVQQVLINLLKNAEESGSPPDAIRMRVDTRDDGLVLTVLDRGGGMDEDTMRKALLPFHSFKKAGSGLGLSLCSEIVEAHGGHMTMARRADGGMAIGVFLPGLHVSR